jgi:two-component SAPR family response regulator
VGDITARKRKDGTVGYTAQIRIRRDGEIVYSDSQTIDRKPAAAAWIKKKEAALAEPGALETLRATDPLLRDVIDQYFKESKRDYGDTKRQVLRTIQAGQLGGKRCSEIRNADLITFAQSLKAKPQTVGNCLTHLASVFSY